MILEGNERGYGAELARHLLNPRDNDHVTIHSIEGFIASDLGGAFAESEAIAAGTQCQKYLFSLSLNPPPDAKVTIAAFEDAIARIEAKLCLIGQPRAVVFHEKNGRRHAHCVWSRIDAQRMRAINMAHSKRKLMDVSIALYRDHGWSMPGGFADHTRRDSLNYSRHEAGQAKRTRHDPKAIKALFKICWEQSDSRAGFAAALWDEGYCLARGDRRGFVAVDAEGKVWSLSRWCGLKSRELSARLGAPDDLPSTSDALNLLQGLANKPPESASPANQEFEERRQRLAESQRNERDRLVSAQEQRLALENRERAARLPKGIRAAWARLNGRYSRLVEELAREAQACAVRDRAERHALIDRHLAERRDLDRRAKTPNLSQEVDAIFAAAVRHDARQNLVLLKETAPFTRAQLVAQPSLILEHLSRNKATFREADIKRALAQFIDDPLALRPAITTALASPELVRLQNDEFTIQDYRDRELQLASAAKRMASSSGFGVDAHHIKVAIREQNERMRKRFGGSLSDEQEAAVRHILDDRQFACVVGLAGSGKSTMLDTARAAWVQQGLRVHGATLSGKAADGLKQASGLDSRTLASLEASWENGYEPIAKGDVVVIDEAGMIGMRQMARIADKLDQVGAKLVLVGDPGQLQPIEAGTPFRDLIESHGAAALKDIHRQKELWQRHASRDLAEGRVQDALNAYDANGSVHRGADQEAAISKLLADYLKDRESTDPTNTQLAFAHGRKDVFALNQAIRQAIRRQADAEADTILVTDTGLRAFAVGDRVVFTRNDKELGIKNGMLGTIDAVDASHMAVSLDGDTGSLRRIDFDPRRYRHLDHGYAVTIHKSQGATVDRAYVLASRSMDEHLTYVAMTRHRNSLLLYVSDSDSPVWAMVMHDSPRGESTRPRTFDRS